jgi:hypothetical protein
LWMRCFLAIIPNNRRWRRYLLVVHVAVEFGVSLYVEYATWTANYETRHCCCLHQRKRRHRKLLGYLSTKKVRRESSSAVIFRRWNTNSRNNRVIFWWSCKVWPVRPVIETWEFPDNISSEGLPELSKIISEEFQKNSSDLYLGSFWINVQKNSSDIFQNNYPPNRPQFAWPSYVPSNHLHNTHTHTVLFLLLWLLLLFQRSTATHEQLLQDTKSTCTRTRQKDSPNCVAMSHMNPEQRKICQRKRLLVWSLLLPMSALTSKCVKRIEYEKISVFLWCWTRGYLCHVFRHNWSLEPKHNGCNNISDGYELAQDLWHWACLGWSLDTGWASYLKSCSRNSDYNPVLESKEIGMGRKMATCSPISQ